MTIGYHYDDVHAHGATLIGQAGSLEGVHKAIVNDVNSAADFWGGVGSQGHQEFVDQLNRNFQVIYDTLSTHGTNVQQAGAHMGDTDGTIAGSWARGV